MLDGHRETESKCLYTQEYSHDCVCDDLYHTRTFEVWTPITPDQKVLRSSNLRHSAPLEMAFLMDVKVKFFRFWPKTMDYNKAFWPKSRSFFVVLLLQNGRCYEAEICAILLLLRCPFRWNPFLTKSNFSDFGQKPWTIYNPWFDFSESEKSCEKSLPL